MPDKLVTIATFSHLVEANLSKAKLQSEGTWCFIADEHMVNWLYSNTMGGVRLQVMESDVQKAIRILHPKHREEPG